MAFKAGAVVGEAILKTAKWSSVVGVIQKSAKAMTGELGTLVKVGFAATTAALIKVTHEANKYQKAFSNVTTLMDASKENRRAYTTRRLGASMITPRTKLI